MERGGGEERKGKREGKTRWREGGIEGREEDRREGGREGEREREKRTGESRRHIPRNSLNEECGGIQACWEGEVC